MNGIGVPKFDRRIVERRPRPTVSQIQTCSCPRIDLVFPPLVASEFVSQQLIEEGNEGTTDKE